MTSRVARVLLPFAFAGCHPAAPPTTPEPGPALDAADFINCVREARRDIPLGPGASDVSLFLAPVAAPTPPRDSEPPCLAAITQPADIATIIPAPAFTEVFASGRDGTLHRKNGDHWEPVPVPAQTPPIPPIMALLGFVEASSPLELVVGVQTGDQSELWTLVIQGPKVTAARPTVLDGPAYQDLVEFLRTHHTPMCRVDDRDCLQWVEVDGRSVVDVASQRYADRRLPLLELGESATVVDMAWADADGDAVYIAATGTPCIEGQSG